MENKVKKSNGDNSAPKNEAVKNANASKSQPKDNAPLIAELQKTNQILLRKLQEFEEKAKQPENLEERIKFFEEKKKKIEHLNLFQSLNKKLEDAFSEIKPIADNEEFSKLEYVLTLSYYNQYSKGEELFKIANPLIIENGIKFILTAIDEKIKSLQLAIQA